MKRTHDDGDNQNGDAGEPPAKRRPLPHALAITSPDTKAVRETYHTDCEIVAGLGEEPRRVFPVNRVIIGSWSEPFRAMVNGEFAEGVNARITLPFEASVVELAVQHMYFIIHYAAAPVIPPECAFALMQLAHMYDQRDLFERCQEPLWKTNTFQKDVPGDVGTLRTMLAMGLPLDDVVKYSYVSEVEFPPFSIDVNDEVLKPFLKSCFSKILGRAQRLMASEYTEEQRTADAYFAVTPERWEFVKNQREELVKAGEDPRITERYQHLFLQVITHSAHTRCGIVSEGKLRQELIRAHDVCRRIGDFREINTIVAMDWSTQDTEMLQMYSRLMRRLYPLPVMNP